MKKFKLTKVTKEYVSLTLYQIEALMDFGNVSKGEKGGYVEKEDNVSQEGNAWVSGDARVSGDAWVYGNVWVSGELKLVGGYFYHTKEKSEEIEKVEINDDYELLASNPQLEEMDENEGKKKKLLNKAQELIDKANELKEKGV